MILYNIPMYHLLHTQYQLESSEYLFYRKNKI